MILYDQVFFIIDEINSGGLGLHNRYFLGFDGLKTVQLSYWELYNSRKDSKQHQKPYNSKMIE